MKWLQLDAQIQAKIWQVLIDESQKSLSLIIFSHNKATKKYLPEYGG